MTKKLAAVILEKYSGTACCDCGKVLPVECMDFDHRDPSTKSHTIRQIRRWVDNPGNRLVMYHELALCDYVCKNDHAIRTKKAREAGLIKDGRPKKRGKEDG
jgi:hypothetical protein